MNNMFYGDEDISNIEINSYTDNDIDESHNVVMSSMDNWELPNQVVTLEIE